MKKSVYLDTTIISFLFDERDSIKNLIEITKDWWNTQRNKFNIYLSLETLAELQAGNYPKKDEAIKLAESLEVLERIPEIEKVAEIYLNNYIMPKNFEGDAIHLAYTSIYKIDFLLTWNCKHLANANKKPHIRQINTKLGLFIPEIITPMELFEE